MPVRYRNRQRRLERTISRIAAARRAIEGHKKTASEYDAWWKRHGGTLDAWRNALAERQRRAVTERPTIAIGHFKRWTSGLRFHPALLRLRLECWWLTVRLGVRGIGRGPRA